MRGCKCGTSALTKPAHFRNARSRQRAAQLARLMLLVHRHARSESLATGGERGTAQPSPAEALDGAATMMTDACDRGMSGKQFVDDCKREGKLIMGIGHRIKSVENPDMRVEIIKKYAQAHFPKTPTLDLAALEESGRARRSPSLDGSPKARASLGDRPSSRPSSSLLTPSEPPAIPYGCDTRRGFNDRRRGPLALVARIPPIVPAD